LCEPGFGKVRLARLSLKGEVWPFWQLPDPSLIGLHTLIVSLNDLIKVCNRILIDLREHFGLGWRMNYIQMGGVLIL
jgi:hypothetical protein